MTTETILTPEQVDALLEGVLRASGSRLGNYTYQKTLDDMRSAIRDIEQAVLLSPEIHELRKDALFGRVAMRFVDRAGDYCKEDPAEKICDEFNAAIHSAMEQQK